MRPQLISTLRQCIFQFSGFCTILLITGMLGCATTPPPPEAPIVEAGPIRAEIKEGPRQVTQAELRDDMMRYADRFLSVISQPLDDIERRQQMPQARIALELKLAYNAIALNIAIGLEPEVNLLDMIVFVSLARITIEDYYGPQVFGVQGKGLLEASRNLEEEIWTISSKVLTSDQQQELRNLIAEWRQNNPDLIYIEGIRFGDFAFKMGKSELTQAMRPGGLLPEVREATQAVDEIRLLSERMLFYLQRMGFIMRYQTMLAVYELGDQPHIAKLTDDSERFSRAMERLSKSIERLPNDVSRERSAAIMQLSQEMEANEETLRVLLADLRLTMTEANTLIVSGDNLANRLGLGKGLEREFTVRDYQKVIEEASVAAINLQNMIGSAERLINSKSWLNFNTGWDEFNSILTQSLDKIGEEGEQIINHTFWGAVVILLIWVLGYVLARLIYRYLSTRIFGLER